MYREITLAILCAVFGLACSAHAWEQKEFVIGLWSPPPPAETTDARYAQIADAGFNLVIGGNGVEGLELNRKMLALASQHGLKCLVVDGRLGWGKPVDDSQVDAVIHDYADSPALMGYVLQDEPSAANFPALAATSAEIAKQDRKHLAYVNLFPTYATPAQLGAKDYADYLARFTEAVKPELLCYDNYPLLKSGERTDFYENLKLVSAAAAHRKVPFWSIVQSEGIEGAYRSPNDSEMRWEVMSAVAYGARGVIYFTYWTPPSGATETHFDGIIQPDGTAHAHYDWVKKINGELRRLERQLGSSPYRGTVATGERIREGYGIVTGLSGDPVIVGEFGSVDRPRYVLVVNRSPVKAARASLVFDDKVWQLYAIGADGSRSNPLLKRGLKFGAHYEAILDPGEDRLYELKYRETDDFGN